MRANRTLEYVYIYIYLYIIIKSKKNTRKKEIN